MLQVALRYSHLIFGFVAFVPLHAVEKTLKANPVTIEAKGEALKKVIILDFKNLDKNPDYNYLED